MIRVSGGYFMQTKRSSCRLCFFDTHFCFFIWTKTSIKRLIFPLKWFASLLMKFSIWYIPLVLIHQLQQSIGGFVALSTTSCSTKSASYEQQDWSTDSWEFFFFSSNHGILGIILFEVSNIKKLIHFGEATVWRNLGVVHYVPIMVTSSGIIPTC